MVGGNRGGICQWATSLLPLATVAGDAHPEQWLLPVELNAPVGPKTGPVITIIREAAREDGGLPPDRVGGVGRACGLHGDLQGLLQGAEL